MSWKSMRTIGAPLGLTLLLAAANFAADDLTITEKITAGETAFTTQRLVKGPRERTTADMGTGVSTVTIRQCDLKRSLTVNDSLKTYMVLPDLEEIDSTKAAAAALLGASPAAESGGTITFNNEFPLVFVHSLDTEAIGLDQIRGGKFKTGLD